MTPASGVILEPEIAPNSGDYPRLRTATAADLDGINRVIESAIATWNLPQRVKRISLPLYRYQAQDLEFMHMVVLETAANAIIGLACWENECRVIATGEQPALLLHGIYVSAAQQGHGNGSRLLHAAELAAAGCGCGMLVKAQADAGPFFQRKGYRNLPVSDPGRDYPHRYYKPLDEL